MDFKTVFYFLVDSLQSFVLLSVPHSSYNRNKQTLSKPPLAVLTSHSLVVPFASIKSHSLDHRSRESEAFELHRSVISTGLTITINDRRVSPLPRRNLVNPFFYIKIGSLIGHSSMKACGIQSFMDSRQASASTSNLSSLRGISGFSVKKLSFIMVAPSKCSRSYQSIQCSSVSFRPCIDIHKGKVKQIVGSTLRDSKDDTTALVTNFESDKSAAEFANLYKNDGLTGGHVIMLGADVLSNSAAIEALRAYPGGLQVGGGINSNNALKYLDEGASHVIVTSYVFNNGQMELERLKDLVSVVGKQRLVLDLSCRKKDGNYAVVTDRWQKFSELLVDEKTLEFLASYADEFLVHGVDVEGKRLGIDEELVALLGRYSPIPVTYAGGVTTLADLERIKVAGMRRVDVTVGSALDIFGGDVEYKDVVAWHQKQKSLAVS